MSLVNDMLRDLEKRGQHSPVQDQAREVRTVADEPRLGRKVQPWLVGLMVVIVFVAVFYGWGTLFANKNEVPPVAATIEPVSVVIAVPEVSATPATEPEALNVFAIRWDRSETGGSLLLDWSRPTDVVLQRQTPRALALLIPDARLGDALPLLPGDLVKDFSLTQQDDGLALYLEAIRESGFKLERSDQGLSITIRLQPVPSRVAAAVTQASEAAPVTLSAPPASAAASAAPSAPAPVSEASAGPRHTDTVVRRKDAISTVQNTAPPVAKAAVQTPSDRQSVARARKLLQQSRVHEAKLLLQQQLSAQPHHHQSRALLAGILLAAGESAQAEQQVDAGLALGGEDSGLKKLKARLLLQRNQAEAAVALLERMPPLVSADAEYHELRASALQKLARGDEAAAVYYQLLQLNSTEPRLWAGLGYSLEVANRRAEAVQAYNSSLQAPHLSDNLKQFVNHRLAQLAGQ